jgi:predicted O-methyltransferase YrrM
MSSSEETEQIKIRYEKRKNNPSVQNHHSSKTFISYMTAERTKAFTFLLKNHFQDKLNSISLIEIGAGNGGNINFFKQLNLPVEKLFANELQEDRLKNLHENHPDIQILSGDARTLLPNYSGAFDVVFQSTVFTSILDQEFKKDLASCCLQMLKPGGIVLWYDFAFDNPKNKDVKGIKKKEIMSLFPNCHIHFQKVTLAPPIGRRVGKLYPIFNSLPFLRTHLIAFIIPKVKS